MIAKISKFAALSAIILCLAACASKGKGALLGGAVGATVGGLATGSPVGAVVGGAAGAIGGAALSKKNN